MGKGVVMNRRVTTPDFFCRTSFPPQGPGGDETHGSELARRRLPRGRHPKSQILAIAGETF